MEKYQIIVKVEQIRKYLEQGECIKAASLAAEIDLKKIKSMSDLSVIAEAYFQSMQYKKARSLFLQIYEKTKSRRILAQLVHLSIKLEDASEAEKYLLEYVKIAPNDFYQYIFRFSIDKLLKKPDEILIKDLEELKKSEYMENWSYELAKLYHKTGDEKRCVAECSDIILWFGSGIYVEKAKALRAYYTGESESEETDSKKQEQKSETSRLSGAADTAGIVKLLKAVGEKKPDQEEKMEDAAEPVKDIQEDESGKGDLGKDESEKEPLTDSEEKAEGNQTKNLEEDLSVAASSEEETAVLEDAKEEIKAEGLEVSEAYLEYTAILEVDKAESNNQEIKDQESEGQESEGEGSDHEEAHDKEADCENDVESEEESDRNLEDEDASEEDEESEDDEDEDYDDDEEESEEEDDDDDESDEDFEDDEESEKQEESCYQSQAEYEEPYRSSAISEEESRALADLFDGVDIEKKGRKKKKSIFSKLKDAIRSAMEEEENRNREEEETETKTEAEIEAKTEAEIKLETEAETKTEVETEAQKEAESDAEKKAESDSENLEIKEEIESSNPVKESIEESSNVQNDKEEIEADLVESSMVEFEPEIETSYESNGKQCLILDEVSEEVLMINPENGLYERLREKQIKAAELAGDFKRVESVRRSIMQCMEHVFDHPSRNVNLMIAGGKQMGKKSLGKLLARDFHALGINPSSKVALIHALRLNRMNLKDKMAQLAGCMLIIEEASELSEESILGLQSIIGDERCQFGIILEGQTEKMDRLFSVHDTLRGLFDNRIFIPEFDANDYLGYAFSYLNARDYQIREDAFMALCENIEQIMKAEGTLEAVTKYLQQVIQKVEGRNAKKIAALTESKEYETAELLVLKVEDFTA